MGADSHQKSIVDAMRRAIIGQESGGSFSIVNRDSGALGYGQVMPENVPSWTKEAIGRSVTPEQFLNSPQIQLATINHKLAEYFEKELEKYNLDSYDEDDAEVGQALLKRDAAKVRASLKEEQSQFVQSIQPDVQEQQVSKEELDAQRNESRKIVETGVSSAIKNNFIKLEANGEGINYQIADKNKVIDYALDSNQFLSTFAKDGQVDWDKWTKVVAFAENPTVFIDELIKHGKSLGRKSMEAELKNVKPVVGASKEVVENSDFQNPFENPVQFLKEMTVSKK